MHLFVRLGIAIVLAVGGGACDVPSDDSRASMDADLGPCPTAERDPDCGLTGEPDGEADAQLVADGGLPDAAQTRDSGGLPQAAASWKELHGPMLGDGSDRGSEVRKPLTVTLEGVPGYAVQAAYALRSLPGSIATTLLVELINLSDIRRCSIIATTVWKSATGTVLPGDLPPGTVQGSPAHLLSADGSVSNLIEHCLEPGKRGYLISTEVAHTGTAPMFDTATNVTLTLQHAVTGRDALPDFLLVPTGYAAQRTGDEDLITVTMTNEGSATAPVSDGTGARYILLDDVGLPIEVGHLTPVLRTPVPARGTVQFSDSLLLFGSAQRMLVNVCMNNCR